MMEAGNGNGTNGHGSQKNGNGSYGNGSHTKGKQYNGFYSGEPLGGIASAREKEREDDEIDLRQLFYTLWHHRWIILSFVVTCTMIAAAVAYTTTPIYRSEGTILISQQQNGPSPAGGDLANLLSSTYGVGLGSTIANELQILRSRTLAKEMADSLLKRGRTADGLRFPVLYSGYPENLTFTTADTVAKRIREQISFSQVDREADLVQIAYESPSPEEASVIVDLAIELYSGLSNRQNRMAANSAVDFLETERGNIENRLQVVEELLRNFMNREQLVQLDAQTEQMIERMADLESRRQEARVKLVAVSSGAEQYRQRLDEIKPGLAGQYADAIGPNMIRLQYQLAELEIEKMQLLANNPGISEQVDQPVELRDVEEKITLYRNRIRSLTEDLMEQSDQYIGFLGGSDGNIAQSITSLNQKLIELQVEQQQYEAQMEVIDEQLLEQRSFFDNLPDNMIEMARLQRDVKISEELYVTVSQQFAEMLLWRETQFGLGRPVDSGFLPEKPVSPNKKLFVVVGFMLGGILGAGFIFVREMFNTKIDGVEKLKKFDYPLLSVIPSMKSYIKEEHGGEPKVPYKNRQITSSMVTLLNMISPISESFRRLQSNIIYSNPDRELKSIMVTSATQGEGKTTVVSNLAVVLADMGCRVLVIDADLRRPNLHNQFGLLRQPGIFEVLFEGVPLEKAIQPTVLNRLSVLPAGKTPPNPSAVSQSKALLELISRVEKGEEFDFDYVLIDTAPYGIITDASALIRRTGGVVVVSRFNETEEAELTHLIHNLQRVEAHILGTVLTAFDFSKTNDVYSTQYHSSYKDYMNYNQDGASEKKEAPDETELHITS